MPTENSITFQATGGHNHNGIGSTLIDSTQYSIFDFSTGTLGSTTRIALQTQNKINLENWIISTVSSKVLQPAGLRLEPNTLHGKSIMADTITAEQISAGTITANEIAAKSITGAKLADGTIEGVNIAANAITANNIAADAITAREIAAGTITATEILAGTITGAKLANGTIEGANLVANTITGAQIATNAVGSDEVNDVMSIINVQSDFVATTATLYSTDYDGTTPGTGSAGWRLWANGDAEFNDVYVRGTVSASAGSIGAYQISGSIYCDTTPWMGLQYDNYRLTLNSNSTITARVINNYDQANDTHYSYNNGFTSELLINQLAATDGASIIVRSTPSGANSVIKPGIIDVNGSITAPSIYGRIYATTSGVSSGQTPVHQSGTAAALVRYTGSKREYKENIQDFTEFGLIDQLRPRIFTWKNVDNNDETSEQKTNRENQFDIGFIAEEVAEIENGRLASFEDDNKTIPSFWRYLDMIALLVAEVQDLRKRVKTLEDGV